MTPERHARIKDVFLAACSVPPYERDAILDDQCGDDTELREIVQRLLLHHDRDPHSIALDRTDSDADPDAPTRIASVSVGESESLDAGQPEEGSVTRKRRFEPGTIVAGRYRIVALLGRGGMGEVYRAEDTKLGQPVALKFLASALASNPTWRERFNAEVRLARLVTHPNVCRVYDVGETPAGPFISMEYVRGENLATLLNRVGPLRPHKALQIGCQICFGLAAAHAQGVLHRDLKPANIMLDDRGAVRITDFGLAGLADKAKQADMYAGTPAYMAPEQLTGHGASIRSDIYALGLVLYELYTGRPAFRAEKISDYIELQQTSYPVIPSEVVPDIEPDVEQAILRCLEKSPDARPASAVDVAAMLSGGDLLAAASAAGETPAPSLVAAAHVRSLPSGSSVLLLLATFATLCTFLFVGSRKDVLWQPDRMIPPLVLAEQATGIIQDVGQNSDGLDSAYGYWPATDTWPFLGGHGSFQSGVSSFAVAPGNRLVFWYRLSDERLIPSNVSNVVFAEAQITPGDPSNYAPGEVILALDTGGRLVYYASKPDPGAALTDFIDAPAWSALVRHAGLESTDFDRLPEPPPEDQLPFHVTQWRGRHPEDETVSIRVIAAQTAKRPVLLAVLREDDPDAAPSTATNPGWAEWLGAVYKTFIVDAGKRHMVVSGYYTALLFVLALVAVPWARRNVRAGRGDRIGAYRIAIFAFGLRMAVWLLQAHHVPLPEAELILFTAALLRAIGEGVLVWLAYMALDPAARRRWPQIIIAWERLLTGQWYDRVVGQHVLIGVLLGAWWAFMGAFDVILVDWLGLESRAPLPEVNDFAYLTGGRHALAVCLEALHRGVYRGMLFVMLLVALLTLVRKKSRAVILAVLILAPMFLPRGAHAATAWFTVGVASLAVGAWAMFRFGLVTVVTAMFVSGVLSSFPTRVGTGIWYSDLTLLALSIAAGLAVSGYATARWGRAGGLRFSRYSDRGTQTSN